MLAATVALLNADALEPAVVCPDTELERGRFDVRQVAEDVAEAVAAADAEVGRVGLGDVVVEVDQDSAIRCGRCASARARGRSGRRS